MANKRTWLIGLSVLLGVAILTVWIWPSSPELPRRPGYLRIAPPDLSPVSLHQLAAPNSLQYDFSVHGSASWEGRPETGWGDIVYPWCRGRLQLTYKAVDGQLAELIDDAHKLAFKHSVVADGIAQKLYINPESRVYAVMFQLQGNAASAVQFFATDSTQHFIRGAAYVYAEPNADSLAPVNAFFEAEVIRFLESLEWGEVKTPSSFPDSHDSQSDGDMHNASRVKGSKN